MPGIVRSASQRDVAQRKLAKTSAFCGPLIPQPLSRYRPQACLKLCLECIDITEAGTRQALDVSLECVRG